MLVTVAMVKVAGGGVLRHTDIKDIPEATSAEGESCNKKPVSSPKHSTELDKASPEGSVTTGQEISLRLQSLHLS